MNRIALALLFAAAASPVLAQSASDRANAQLQRDMSRDRVGEAARDLDVGGRPQTPAVVDDMDRTRGLTSLSPDRRDSPATLGSPREQSSEAIPGLGDNVQR